MVEEIMSNECSDNYIPKECNTREDLFAPTFRREQIRCDTTLVIYKYSLMVHASDRRTIVDKCLHLIQGSGETLIQRQAGMRCFRYRRFMK